MAYVISDDCVACGTCESECPVGAISMGEEHYEIDADGHGVTLTLKKSGRGLIYMEAGEPINDAALFLIEVNL